LVTNSAALRRLQQQFLDQARVIVEARFWF